MRRTLFVAVATMVFVGLMAGTALAHVCFINDKPQGAGSAGEASIVLHIAVDEFGNEVGFEEEEPDLSGLNINEKSGRLIGGFATLTFTVNVWLDNIGEGEPVMVVGPMTADVLVQNTVGGGAHFA